MTFPFLAFVFITFLLFLLQFFPIFEHFWLFFYIFCFIPPFISSVLHKYFLVRIADFGYIVNSFVNKISLGKFLHSVSAGAKHVPPAHNIPVFAYRGIIIIIQNSSYYPYQR